MNKLIASTTIEGRVQRLYANVSSTQTYSYALWCVGATVHIRGTMVPKVASLVRSASSEHSLIEGVISLLCGQTLSYAQCIATPQLAIAETPASNVVPQLNDAKFVAEANAEWLQHLKLEAEAVAASVKVGEHRFNDPADAERFMLTAIDLGYNAQMYPADDITPEHRFSDTWGVSVTVATLQLTAEPPQAAHYEDHIEQCQAALQAELDASGFVDATGNVVKSV